MSQNNKRLLMHQTLHRTFNELHNREGIPVLDINAYALGMITCSLQNQIGAEAARDFIESAMNNVWGPKPKKKWWKRT